MPVISEQALSASVFHTLDQGQRTHWVSTWNEPGIEVPSSPPTVHLVFVFLLYLKPGSFVPHFSIAFTGLLFSSSK